MAMVVSAMRTLHVLFNSLRLQTAVPLLHGCWFICFEMPCIKSIDCFCRR
jgi:hypothetical protein